ncbi:hypothetical protein HWV62_28025 [Athelia sp. TMB]|nr:hypothetical protein HWV62_28025 [Athelia sp. TMB]
MDGVISVSALHACLFPSQWLPLPHNASIPPDALEISNVALNITFMPHWAESGTPLTNYNGYVTAKDTSGFHDEDFLTKLWYGVFSYEVVRLFLKTSLLTIFSIQNPTSGSPLSSGPPISSTPRDSYQSRTLIGAPNYYIYTGDLDFV